MAYNTSYSARKKTGVTYETIIREVRAGELKPVYFLMGEESYYIDRVSDFIVDAVLKKTSAISIFLPSSGWKLTSTR